MFDIDYDLVRKLTNNNINLSNFIKLFDNIYYDNNCYIWRLTNIENGFCMINTGIQNNDIIHWGYYFDNNYIIFTYKSMMFYVISLQQYELDKYNDDILRELCGYFIYKFSTDLEFLLSYLSKLEENTKEMFINKLNILKQFKK